MFEGRSCLICHQPLQATLSLTHVLHFILHASPGRDNSLNDDTGKA